MDQKKTGEYLKQLRKARGLTQEQLAERFGLSSRTVSRWETGRSLPSVELLIALADLYHVDIRQIMDPEGSGGETKDALRTVAAYAAAEKKQTQFLFLQVALGTAIVLLVCTRLFAGETVGLLYGIIPRSICRTIMILVYTGAIALLVTLLKAYGYQEKPSWEPEKTVAATVISKQVRPGTHGAGRSKGGWSYTVNFRTGEGQTLELFTYETEFGGLKEGSGGMLTYQGRYFVRFRQTD